MKEWEGDFQNPFVSFKILPMNKRILLIDATSLAFRAYYAFIRKPLVNSKGINTSGPFAFINSLEKLKRELSPSHIMAIFDAPHKTFRHELYAEYKAQRPKPPEEIRVQIELIKELLDAYEIKYLEIEGVEADDVIASFVERYKGVDDLEIYISTQDKDLLQLVGNRVYVVSGMNNQFTVYSPFEVVNKFGVPPEKIPDYLALRGDSVDNIPGVKGIGEKTAVKLLQKYESIEDLYEHIDEIEPSIRDKLLKYKEDCYFSKKLVLLKRDVEIPISLDDIKLKQPERKKLANVLKYLEFESMLKELASKGEPLDFKKASSLPFSSLSGFAFDIAGQELFIVDRSDRGYTVDINVARDALQSESISKYVFDYKNLYKTLLKQNIVLNGVTFDFPLASYLLQPERGNYTRERFIVEEFLMLPSNNKKQLAEQTAYMVYELKDDYLKSLKNMGLLSLYTEIELPLARILGKMEHYGTLIDIEYLGQLKNEIEESLSGIVEKLYEMAGGKINLNSPRQIAKVLFEKLGLPPVKKTKTGYSTDQETLEKLKDKHEFVKLLLDYRELYKIKSTYIDSFFKLVDNTGRVHPVFNQMHTATGRLSCSNPNLQNLPIRSDIGKKIRKAIVAPEGYLIASFDYSQIELRITAHLSGEDAMIEAFKKNADIHSETASLIFQKPKEDITQKERRIAKTVNFGIIYGISPYGLSKQLGISQEEAQGIIYNFFAIYPGVHEWVMRVLQETEEKGYTTTLFGRIRRIPELKSSNNNIREAGKRLAINTPVQGSAADIIKKAMVLVDDFIERERIDAHLILQVHDELVFEVKEEIKDEFMGKVRDIMENVVKLSVPLKVDAGVGKNWLEAH